MSIGLSREAAGENSGFKMASWASRAAGTKFPDRAGIKAFQHIRDGLSSRERMFFNQYNMALSKFMRKSGDLDITQHLQPPKSLYVEVKRPFPE